MAEEHEIKARILLRYDTFDKWKESNVILKVGEAAIVSFPRKSVIDSLSDTLAENTPPAIGIKIGDGRHPFDELPWVQAIAADVYEWAKSSQKPTYNANDIYGLESYIKEKKPSYSANEIYGLENYIKEKIHGGEISMVPRIYSIVKNNDKYYLQYKENAEDDWKTVPDSDYIDLENLTKLLNWINLENLEDYTDLTTLTGLQTLSLFDARLKYTDTPIDNYYVTEVNEEGGKISVTRARPTFSNIKGNVSVEQGGTGRTDLSENNVLVGNGTDMIKLVPIAESIANNDYLVPNRLVKDYVDNAVKGLTGAMHFIGEATVTINNNGQVKPVDPRIEGYNFSNAQPGDVILYDKQEYVWNGSNWHLLGDEGSYAVKGSITNSDISEEAAISQDKIFNLTDSLNSKVDKIEGKSLSSNDFTNDLKEKLESIGNSAETNIIEHIFLNGDEIKPTTVDTFPKSIDLKISEFTGEAQRKLEGIQNNAQVNIIEKIIYDGDELKPENKTITISPNNPIEHIFLNGVEMKLATGDSFPPKSINLEIFTKEDQDKLKDIEPGAQVNKVEKIIFNDKEISPDENKIIKIEHPIEHIFLNKTEIKPAEINSLQRSIKLEINEFTPEYEEKLNGIAAGAEVNTIESIYVNNTKIIPVNKRLDINFLTITQKQLNKLDALNINAQENIIESISLNDVPQTIIDKNVNLIINEFTAADEQKLDNIEAGAQVNTIETIYVNDKRYRPNSDKEIKIVVIDGAKVPGASSGLEDVDIIQNDITQSKKLQFARIAKTGNIEDIIQSYDSYVILDCGTSTSCINTY